MGKTSVQKKILCGNVKILTFKNIALAFVYMFAIFLLYDINNLDKNSDKNSVAFISEYLISPIGILLFATIAIIENDIKIYELTFTKIYPHYKVVLNRILLVSLELLVILLINFSLFKLLGGKFNFIKIFVGTFISCFYLGTISMFLAYLTKQKVIGYLVPSCYYFFELVTYGKYTKDFYLFGMINGQVEGKIKLFIISLILILIMLFFIKKK